MDSIKPTQSTLEKALRASFQIIKPNPEYVRKLQNQLHNAREVIIEQKPVVARTMLMILAFAGTFALTAALLTRILGKK